VIWLQVPNADEWDRVEMRVEPGEVQGAKVVKPFTVLIVLVIAAGVANRDSANAIGGTGYHGSGEASAPAAAKSASELLKTFAGSGVEFHRFYVEPDGPYAVAVCYHGGSGLPVDDWFVYLGDDDHGYKLRLTYTDSGRPTHIEVRTWEPKGSPAFRIEGNFEQSNIPGKPSTPWRLTVMPAAIPGATDTKNSPLWPELPLEVDTTEHLKKLLGPAGQVRRLDVGSKDFYVIAAAHRDPISGRFDYWSLYRGHDATGYAPGLSRYLSFWPGGKSDTAVKFDPASQEIVINEVRATSTSEVAKSKSERVLVRVPR
jgi:hypothetical protein